MIKKLPVIIVFIGILIHLLGILDILKITTIKVDVIMFILDILVLYGLLTHKKLGWILGILLFLQQSIMQPYWAYQAINSNFYIFHPLEWLCPSLLVILCLIILLVNKSYFVRE